MEIVDVAQDGTPEDVATVTVARRPKRGFRIGRSKKMMVGLIVLGIFVVLAIIGPIVAPYKPRALGPLTGPSARGL